ncbi:cytidylate kinase-like family protein, partial [Ruminococcaceae bacterium OttesenSCG-928-A11]|nr:cytidylate kinase-like family protein [Ruminococcaceae bacterium OttesenSCG-928-A11]
VSGLLHTPPPMEFADKAPSYADYVAYLPNDQMQNALADVIRDAAEKSPCVIIGRCGDYVLRGQPGMVSVFVHAPLEQRIQRIAKMHNLDEDRARSLVRKTDRSRANYYSYYTDRDWGRADNYDLVLDAGRLGIDKSVLLLKAAVAHFAP